MNTAQLIQQVKKINTKQRDLLFNRLIYFVSSILEANYKTLSVEF